MPYTSPSLEEQRAFLLTIDKVQTKRDTKPLKRLLAIHPEEKDADKIISGGIILEAEKIAVQYRKYGQAPEGGYLYKGSQLYIDLMKKALKESKDNPLDVETKLMNLNSYYQYRRANIEEDQKANAELNSEFQPVVEHLLGQLLNMNTILTTRPNYPELMKRLEKQPEIYAKECTGRRWTKTNENHINYMQFIKLFTHPLMDKLVNDDSIGCTTELKKKQFIYSACYGALLYMMKQIEFEYAGYIYPFNNPESSYLYCFCQNTTNLKHSNDVPEVHQVNLLVDFARLLEITKNNPEAMKFLQMKKRFLGMTFDENDALAFINAVLKNLESELTKETFIWTCTKNLGNYAVQALIFAACVEVGAGVYAAGIGKDVLPFILGRFGREFMGGRVGEHVMRTFAKQLEPGLFVGAYANGLFFGLHKAKDLCYPHKDPTFRTARISKQFDAELKEELKDDRRQPTPLLLALVELPSKTVTPAVKKRIENVIIAPVRPSLPEDLDSAKDYVKEEKEVDEGERYRVAP